MCSRSLSFAKRHAVNVAIAVVARTTSTRRDINCCAAFQTRPIGRASLRGTGNSVRQLKGGLVLNPHVRGFLGLRHPKLRCRSTFLPSSVLLPYRHLADYALIIRD